MQFNLNGGLKGRPKGSKNKKDDWDDKPVHEFSLKWVGKHKRYKTKREWETDDEFKKDFMENGLPVRKCTNLSGGSLYRFYAYDLEYAR